MTAAPADDPGRMRASDADRERVARVLNTAMVEGRITAGELDERLRAVYGAKTLGELVPVTRDLPAHQRPPLAVPAPVSGPAVATGPESGFVGAMMSGTTRQGEWTVPRHLTALSVMGGIVLDLSRARFAAPEVTITAVSLMGGVEIKVPEGVTVISTGVGLMGGFEDRTPPAASAAGGPVVRVNGVAIMGGVEIRRSDPGRTPLTS